MFGSRKRVMISGDILASHKFRTMPYKTRLFYIYLAAHADDDGIVDLGLIKKMFDFDDDDEMILKEKNYLFVFPEDPNRGKIAFIMDWFDINTFASNYKPVPSVYRDLLLDTIPAVEGRLKNPTERKMNLLEESHTLLEVNDYEVHENECEQKNSLKEQEDKKCVSIRENTFTNKIKLNQNKISSSCEQISVPMMPIGKYSNIYLSDEDWNLVKTFPNADELIDAASENIHLKRGVSQSHYRLIEREAIKRRYISAPYKRFGSRFNLTLTKEQYDILDDIYVNVKKHLNELANKIYGKEINDIYSYVFTVAKNNKWTTKEEENIKQKKLEEIRKRSEESEKAEKVLDEKEYLQRYNATSIAEADKKAEKETLERLAKHDPKLAERLKKQWEEDK